MKMRQKIISEYCVSGISLDHVQRIIDNIPEEYKEYVYFISEPEGFSIEYSRQETQEEADIRFMKERRNKARKIIDGKRLSGEELPEWTEKI